MFVLNIKFTSKKLLYIFGIISVTAAIICVLCMVSMQSRISDTATCDELGEYSLNAESAEQETEFLCKFGLTPVNESRKIRNIIIPSEFNDAYIKYNELQKSIGLDLEQYKGKDAQEITYKLKNKENQYAVLLVFKDRIIGAHLTNGEYGNKNMPII